jgi:hypothetical protein
VFFNDEENGEADFLQVFFAVNFAKMQVVSITQKNRPPGLLVGGL